jgi:hypothetical protein
MNSQSHPWGVSVPAGCRSDGNYRRDSGCKHHEARDRCPHELRRPALSEGGRVLGGGTSAPDCKEHRGEHTGGNECAHSQYHESHGYNLLRAGSACSRSEFALQASERQWSTKGAATEGRRAKLPDVAGSGGRRRWRPVTGCLREGVRSRATASERAAIDLLPTRQQERIRTRGEICISIACPRFVRSPWSGTKVLPHDSPLAHRFANH